MPGPILVSALACLAFTSMLCRFAPFAPPELKARRKHGGIAASAPEAPTLTVLHWIRLCLDLAIRQQR